MSSTKAYLIGQSEDDLIKLISNINEPKFRAKQIFKWLYAKSCRDFTEMSDLNTKLKQKLADNFQIGQLALIERQVSSDNTKKYLFETPAGDFIESVLMEFDDRDSYTVCISSQVGCAVKCPFCSTGTLGFQKNLTAAQIIEQVLFIQNLEKLRVTNIVFMGQGEPLNNYDEVVDATKKLRDLVGIGARHITISTSGVIPKIDQLALEKLQITLALSLHDPHDKDRDYLVPINKKWPIEPLMNSMNEYVEITGRRVTIEYVLLDELNTSEKKAIDLGKLTQNLHCNINLIPYNQSSSDDPFKRPAKSVIEKFASLVSKHSKNKTVTVRKEKGHDIKAACGQLESSYRK